MTTLTYAQLEGLWLQTATGTKYGTQAWAALMAAIAMAESGGNADATNPDDNGGLQTSWGLWQISLGNHTAPAPNWADPSANAQLALGKLQSQGLTAWGTYTSGAYKAYMNGSTTPDTNIPANPDATATETSAQSLADCQIGFAGVNAGSFLGLSLGSNIGQFCLLSKSQARGVMGTTLLAGGVVVAGFGLGVTLSAVRAPLMTGALSAVSGGLYRQAIIQAQQEDAASRTAAGRQRAGGPGGGP